MLEKVQIPTPAEIADIVQAELTGGFEGKIEVDDSDEKAIRKFYSPNGELIRTIKAEKSVRINYKETPFILFSPKASVQPTVNVYITEGKDAVTGSIRMREYDQNKDKLTFLGRPHCYEISFLVLGPKAEAYDACPDAEKENIQ